MHFENVHSVCLSKMLLIKLNYFCFISGIKKLLFSFFSFSDESYGASIETLLSKIVSSFQYSNLYLSFFKANVTLFLNVNYKYKL